MERIDKSNPNAWTDIELGGYQPTFSNTKSLRGNGIGTGFGKGVIMEDILSPPAKKVPRSEDYEELLDTSYALFSAGLHDHYMDMRINSSSNRKTLTRVVQFLLFPMAFILYLIPRLGSSGQPWTDLAYFEWVEVGVMLSLILYELLKPIATPVRFNYTTQEVYAYHKGALYRIPWQECNIACMYAPHFMGVGGLAPAYNLNLWLYPKHCVNGKAGKEPIALILRSEVEDHTLTYHYWEYIRLFMQHGSKEISREEEKHCHTILWDVESSLIKRILFFPLAVCIWMILAPSALYLWLNPFKIKWPKEVHEWTGEVRNWH